MSCDPTDALDAEETKAVKQLSRELLHRGPIFELSRDHIRLPSGLEQQLEVIRHSGAICIAARDDRGRLLCVRQYRHAVEEWTLEIPAGRLEPGEDALTAARRELEEETGHRAGNWSRVREFYCAPGFCSERLVLFLATDLQAIPGGGLACDADEEIEVVSHSPAELLELSRDAKTLLAAALLVAERPHR